MCSSLLDGGSDLIQSQSPPAMVVYIYIEGVQAHTHTFLHNPSNGTELCVHTSWLLGFASSCQFIQSLFHIKLKRKKY